MGKYAYVKLSIILYHKLTDLSMGFIEFLKIIFLKSFGKWQKCKRKAAIAACQSRFDSGFEIENLLFPQLLIYILKEHLHNLALAFLVIKKQGEEVLVLLIAIKQSILNGIEVCKLEIAQGVVPCTIPQMTVL